MGLAQLNTLMHSSNDVCFGQELVRDELTGPTATPSVWLPAAIVETEASKRTSSFITREELRPGLRRGRRHLSCADFSLLQFMETCCVSIVDVRVCTRFSMISSSITQV